MMLSLVGQRISSAHCWLTDASPKGSPIGGVVLETHEGHRLEAVGAHWSSHFDVETIDPSGAPSESAAVITSVAWLQGDGSLGADIVRLTYARPDDSETETESTSVMFSTAEPRSFTAHVLARRVPIASPLFVVDTDWRANAVRVAAPMHDVPELRGLGALASTMDGANSRLLLLSMSESQDLLVWDGEALWRWHEADLVVPDSHLAYGLNLLGFRIDTSDKSLVLEVNTFGTDITYLCLHVGAGGGPEARLFTPYAYCE